MRFADCMFRQCSEELHSVEQILGRVRVRWRSAERSLSALFHEMDQGMHLGMREDEVMMLRDRLDASCRAMDALSVWERDYLDYVGA